MTNPKHMLVENRSLRWILLISGWVAFVLGMVGLLLPVVPTTPFLLLAAACWVRSSPRFYLWLITHRWFGRYLRYYLNGQGIPRRIKALAIGLLWLTILPTALLIVPHTWASASMMAVGLLVSLYLIRQPEPDRADP